MLYCAADNVFLAADQVLAKITPNISVWAVDPEGDPLGLYVRSLSELKARIPADALVLPGHQLPFYGLHTRSRRADRPPRDALRHDRRGVPRRARARPPSWCRCCSPATLDPHQMSFAFSEARRT